MRITDDQSVKLLAFAKTVLEEKKEPNEYLVWGGRKGNFHLKVFKNKEGHLKVDSNDFHAVHELLAGRDPFAHPAHARVVWVDDAGCGCPLGGIMMGAFDEATKKFAKRVVPETFFQGQHKRDSRFLDEIAREVEEMLAELKCDQQSCLVRLCSGHVNAKARERLREHGWRVDISRKIEDPLQTLLEDAHAAYLLEKFGFYCGSKNYIAINLKAQAYIKSRGLKRFAKE